MLDEHRGSIVARRPARRARRVDRRETVAALHRRGPERRHGTRTDGNMAGARPEVLAELAARIAAGHLELPIAATYRLEDVRDAYRELEQRHTLGKIVLVP